MCPYRRPSRRGTYFMKFVFCEVLNLVNVLGQIYFTDLFLGFQFTQFGRDVLSQSELDLNTREDPMHRVFPKVAKVKSYIYYIITLYFNSQEMLPMASGFSCLYLHWHCLIVLMYLFAFQCRFNKYGPSGSIQTHDALCVLPINIINEKIYIFLYFWFVFLGAVSAAWLLYRLLTIFSKDLRVNIIHFRSDRMVRNIFSYMPYIYFHFIIPGP